MLGGATWRRGLQTSALGRFPETAMTLENVSVSTLNEVVNEVFEISGFSTISKVFPTDAEALDGV